MGNSLQSSKVEAPSGTSGKRFQEKKNEVALTAVRLPTPCALGVGRVCIEWNTAGKTPLGSGWPPLAQLRTKWTGRTGLDGHHLYRRFRSVWAWTFSDFSTFHSI